MSVEALVAQSVGGKPSGKRIYTAGEAAVVGREYQNHWNSISRSEGDDPTFRESLRIRAQRLAAHTQLPPVGFPTHTNTLIIWYLRRVNHFLRPWDVALAWVKIVLEYSKCIFVSFSSCIHPSMLLPSVHSHSYNKQPFNILYWKETLQPTEHIKTTLTELNDPAGLNALLYSHTALSPRSLSLPSAPWWPLPLRLWILIQAVEAWYQMSIEENWWAYLWWLGSFVCRALCLHCPQEVLQDSAEWRLA